MLQKVAGAHNAEHYAQHCEFTGKVLVAIMTHSRYKDVFCGQWLLSNVPFRNVDDLWTAKTDLVPWEHKYLSPCLEHRPRYWRDLDAIEKDLQLESHRDHAVKSLVSMIAAHTEVVDMYWNGPFFKKDRDPLPLRFEAPAHGEDWTVSQNPNCHKIAIL